MEKSGRAGQATDDSIIWPMRIECWKNNAAVRHPEYVIIIAFPVQKWLRERASEYYCIPSFYVL